MIPSNSSASAAALQADVENSNSSELSSVQNDSVKMPDDAENAEGGSQTSDDIGKEAKKKIHAWSLIFMLCIFLLYNFHKSTEDF